MAHIPWDGWPTCCGIGGPTDLGCRGVAISTLTVALAIVGAYLALRLNIQQAGARLVTGAILMVALESFYPREQARTLPRKLAGHP
ncbi:hypothetical protein DFAR_2740001 [Desulfarculales bacterium]